MQDVPRGAPFADRGGWARGVLDLISGRYPPFLFGFGVRSLLPVFHFHQVTPGPFEQACRYLAENRYRTVDSDELAAFLRGSPLPPRSVMLAFDDALASLWLVAGPLLKRYGLRAVAYAIPSRLTEAAALRPTLDDGPIDAETADAGDQRFVSWQELEVLSSSGVVDVQSHTWSHSMIFCGAEPVDVVRPTSAADDPLSRPRLNVGDPPAFLTPDRLGWPLFARQSRMSPARRFLPDEQACAVVSRHVMAHGGAAFFEHGNWRSAIAPLLGQVSGRWEQDDERARAIDHELAAAREALESRLGTRVRHVCLPWGVTSPLTVESLQRLGFETAFANRLPGVFGVRTGDHPFYLKRLPNRHLFALPGQGRRALRTFA